MWSAPRCLIDIERGIEFDIQSDIFWSISIKTLFAAHQEAMIIQQGRSGDCYLLASLDCILSSGSGGIEKIKSLFTKTTDGVTVRIPYSDISKNLKKDQCIKKYGYHDDDTNQQHVFDIREEVLVEIDQEIETKTILAVKVLEKLSCYFYLNDVKSFEMTLDAHNFSNRHEGTSTAFVGDFLGITAKDESDIERIIRLKTLEPNYPIYMSMDSKKVRHAFRLKTVDTDEWGQHVFSLVNPHNNTQTPKRITLAHIQKNKSRFCSFIIDGQGKFLYLLSGISLDDAIDILRNQDLSTLLTSLMSLKKDFCSEDINHTFLLFKQFPKILELFRLLNLEEQPHFLMAMERAAGDKEIFFCLFLSQVFRLPPVEYVLKNVDEMNKITLKMVFNNFLKRAVDEKKSQDERGWQEIKKQIEVSLRQYYQTGDLRLVTRSGSLRQLMAIRPILFKDFIQEKYALNQNGFFSKQSLNISDKQEWEMFDSIDPHSLIGNISMCFRSWWDA